MWINVKKLEKKLNHLVDEEYGLEFVLSITELKISYFDNKPQITLIGNFSRSDDNDDDNVWCKLFEIDFDYKYLKNTSFIKGLLCQYIYERERNE